MPTEIIDQIELRDRSGGIRLNGQNIEYVEKRIYIVDAKSKTETRVAVLNTTGLPIVGISQLSTGATCSGLDAVTMPDNPRYWRVTAEFSTNAEDQQMPSGTAPSANPTTWVPIWKSTYETVDKEVVIDANGVPLRNSAKDKFDGSISVVRPVGCWSFTQYESDTLTELQIESRMACVNETEFKGFPKYSLLVNISGSERGYFNGYRCRKIDYIIKHFEGAPAGSFKYFNTESDSWENATEAAGWRRLVQDVGYQYYNGSGVKVPYLVKGHRTLANLDGNGEVVADSLGPTYLAFDVFKPINFYSFLRV